MSVLFSGKILSYVAARLTVRYWVPYLLRLATNLPLFAIICHYSTLCATIRTILDYLYYSLFAIRYSGLFAVRYSQLFVIHYSDFLDTHIWIYRNVQITWAVDIMMAWEKIFFSDRNKWFSVLFLAAFSKRKEKQFPHFYWVIDWTLVTLWENSKTLWNVHASPWHHSRGISYSPPNFHWCLY